MAEYLPPEIDTCLYLDVDILALCDIREIFSLKCDSTLACVPDFGRYANRILKPIKNAPAITFSKNYFNSGFLRIHLKQWRAQNIQEQCLKILENYHLKFHDQDILNAVFAQNYHKLSFCYDFIAQAFGASVCKDESKHHYNIHHTRDEFNRIRENIKILHFCSEKPWNTLASYIYEGQSSQHFGGNLRKKRPFLIKSY
ncbi:MAG: hypothetical protein MRZ19_01920 [Helicobacter sp.]|nr:hypothetical protein [Helicobacter sp.]